MQRAAKGVVGGALTCGWSCAAWRFGWEWQIFSHICSLSPARRVGLAGGFSRGAECPWARPWKTVASNGKLNAEVLGSRSVVSGTPFASRRRTLCQISLAAAAAFPRFHGCSTPLAKCSLRFSRLQLGCVRLAASRHFPLAFLCNFFVN